MAARLDNIQALRGVAALMVLFAHVKEAEIDYGGMGTLLPHWPYMGVVGVDLFFLISGFVMVHVANAAPRGSGAARRFLFNRAARIYPIYWVVTLLLMALYAGKFVLFAEPTPFPNPVETFFLLPDDHYPLLPVGWTLVHEMYFYVVFSVFVVWRRISAIQFLSAWAFVVLIANLLGWADIHNSWARLAFNPLTFEFIAGAAIALLSRKGATRFALPALILGIAILIVETGLFADDLYPSAMGQFSLRALLFGPPFALILYGASALEAKNGTVAPNWLVKTGDASYSLYLIHVPVFLVVGKLVSISVPDDKIDNIVLITAFTASALVAAIAVHKLAERPLLTLTKRFGNKVFSQKSQTDVAQKAAW